MKTRPALGPKGRLYSVWTSRHLTQANMKMEIAQSYMIVYDRSARVLATLRDRTDISWRGSVGVCIMQIMRGHATECKA